MTAAAGRADRGNGPARRAILRWARRLFRREWRQQLAVLALLSLTVAAAIGFSTATYNTVGVPENATFGTANHLLRIDDPAVEALPGQLAAARDRFGDAALIGRWTQPIPGSVESVEYRAQQPEQPVTDPMLALLAGRYPTGSDEVALSDVVATTFQVGLGDTFDLDGHRRRVVGTVENPSDLDDEFALVGPDQLAPATSATLLLGGRGDIDEVTAIRAFAEGRLGNAELTSRADVRTDAAAAIVLAVAQVVLVLVSLVASAGFAAIAHRRLRQLGMLGALGAEVRHLRLVVVANGLLIGATAAIVGTAVGLAGWVVAAPRLETAAGHRIDAANVPWGLVALTVVLVVATATTAAWWPARSVARVPVTAALSGRPPIPRPTRHSMALAAVLLAAGIALLAVGGPVAALGAAVAVVGVMLLSPAAIRAAGLVARPLPIAARLALRDLARHRARSGVALAAIALALGIPAAVLVTASAASASTGLGNLGAHQLLVWTRDADQPPGVSPFYTQDPDDEGFSPYLPDLDTGDLATLATAVAEIAARVDATSVTGLDVVFDPEVDDPDGRRAVTLARPTDIGHLDVALLYAATPGLLDAYDVVDRGAAEIISTGPTGPTDIVTDPDSLWLASLSTPPEPVAAVREATPTYASLPGSFATPALLEERGWDTQRVGWLVERDRPLTAIERADARNAAAAAGLLVETRTERADLVSLRWAATGTGTLAALGVLSLTVGIIRAEASRDLRILTATGATRAVRRALTATTAGGLALLGALLGVIGAYLVLAGGYLDARLVIDTVPVLQLTLLVAGVPLVAAGLGWLVSGRDPPAISRPLLD